MAASVEDKTSYLSPRPPPRPSHVHSISQMMVSWWWWWEIGATLISVTCVSLIISLLFRANGTLLREWPFQIQPNSILAVLTTIMKTTLLVPIASCIGQLKWRHYALQPRPLDQLQVIDDASRGPWGSIVVLLKLAGHDKAGHFKAFILQGAAIISILALAIDPSVQQIIKLQVIEFKTPSPKALIGRADMYYSRLYDASQSSRFSDFSPGWYAEAAKRFPGVKICKCLPPCLPREVFVLVISVNER